MKIRLFILIALILTSFAPGSYAAKLELSHVDSTFQLFERNSQSNGNIFQKENDTFDKEIKELAKVIKHIPYHPQLIYSYVIRFEPQISAVPIPAAFWLFGSGLLGLAGYRRKEV